MTTKVKETTKLPTWAYMLFVVFGLLLGVGIVESVWLIFLKPQQGASFTSLDDLRSQMEKSDSRDLKSDKSVSLRAIIDPDTSDEIIYKLRSSLDVKFQGVPVRTNSLRMRGPEVPLDKDPNSFRLLLLGDSFAFGWGVNEESSFARLTEQYLQEQSPHLRVELLNAAVPGYSTFQEVAKYLQYDHLVRPDAVIVYFVENDFGLPFFIGDSDGADPLMAVASFARRVWAGKDQEAVKRHQFLQSVVDPNKALRKLSISLKEKGVPLFVVVNPGKDAERIPRKLWITKEDPSIKIISLTEEVKAKIIEQNLKKEELQLKGDAHPSARKHQIIAQEMTKKLLTQLSAIQR